MSKFQPYLDESSGEVPVQGFLHTCDEPSGDGLILTHGAGANCNAPLLISLSDAFCASGFTVLRCNLPFRQMRPKGPPQRGGAERDQLGLKAAVASLRRQTPGRIFLGGHSYGGRQATMLVATEPGIVDCLLLLSYPLHPPQRPDELRTAHFPRIQIPAFFVHGERDGFGTLPEMTAALKLIPAPTELLLVGGAGHELMTPKNRDDLQAAVVQAFGAFACGKRG